MKSDFKQQWNMTCLSAGIPALSLDKCARILAIVMVAGNNEEMTHNPVFRADLEYIQKRFHINGGETIDPVIIEPLKKYMHELEEYENIERKMQGGIYKDSRPQWVVELLAKYGIKTIN